MKCCWIEFGSEDPCGLDAEVRSNIAMCVTHDDTLRARKGTTARQSYKFHGHEAFPGFCYVARLPDGLFKIGYSNTEDLVKNRMKSLSRSYGGGVVELLRLPGGFVTEAVLHWKFKEFAVPGTGERFFPVEEIKSFIQDPELK